VKLVFEVGEAGVNPALTRNRDPPDGATSRNARSKAPGQSLVADREMEPRPPNGVSTSVPEPIATLRWIGDFHVVAVAAVSSPNAAGGTLARRIEMETACRPAPAVEQWPRCAAPGCLWRS
jgi:hypothetical protein